MTFSSGIETRASTLSLDSGFCCQQQVPSISDIDLNFRKAGVDLTAQACRKALRESRADLDLDEAAAGITHTVSCQGGVQTFPGYDFHVARQLGLGHEVEQILLQGVGCAGSMSILRVAAEIALGAEALGKPARILCFACELNVPYSRHFYAVAEAATDEENMDIAGSLFSDGAAAFVLCNKYGLDQDDDGDDDDEDSGSVPLFRVVDWERAVAAGTVQYMGASITPTGYTSTITKQVPELTRQSIPPLFERCFGRYKEKTGRTHLGIGDLDFAIHPGGMASELLPLQPPYYSCHADMLCLQVIENAQQALGLDEKQLRATRQIYRTRGNSGSPSALCVLDLMRTLESPGKDDVVAMAFGPGLASEMAMLSRCRRR